MPYKNLSQLPEKVRSHLPIGAQKIFMEAFNHAWDQYADPEKRTLGGSQEEAAHRVAWSAVKKKYERKSEGRWIRK